MTDHAEREKLLPCPFCGASGCVIGEEDGWNTMFYAACTNQECFCAIGERYDRDAMPEHRFQSEQEATSAWQARAALDAAPAGEDEDYQAIMDECRVVDGMRGHAAIMSGQAKGYMLDGATQIDRLKKLVETLRTTNPADDARELAEILSSFGIFFCEKVITDNVSLEELNSLVKQFRAAFNEQKGRK